ncbi:MAG: hypothetical protein HZC02_01230 [Candidatus Levybacteria bacterium]|nr:hypothetical protein [Candidatus Levybacteria bacterium]
MEIASFGTNSIRIKGKNASIIINPQDKGTISNAVILIGNPQKSSLKIPTDTVIIDGPGEYEAGGIKMTGVKAESQTVYTVTVDGVEILLGDREALEKAHQKLKDHNIAVVFANTFGNISFAPSLAMNAILFTGEKGRECVDTIAKDTKKEVPKYTISVDKLPSETETILLS